MWAEVVARLHLQLGNVLQIVVGNLGVILTCLFCWFRGSRPDRIGAVVFAIFWVAQTGTGLVHLWLTGDVRAPMPVDVACSVTPALVFLWLAFRHDNLWFGSVALFQGLQFALDAADQALREPAGTLLPLILIGSMNVLNLAMMAAMIGSAWSGHRRRQAVAGPGPRRTARRLAAGRGRVGLTAPGLSGVRHVE